MTLSPRAIAATLSALAVAAAIAAGLVLLGPPSEERARRLDRRRLEDLRQLAAAVDLLWTRDGRLPSSLDEPPEGTGAPPARDPETGAPYEYAPLGGSRYRLCATFSGPSEAGGRYGPERDFWAHGPGRHCFEVEAERVERVERWN